MKENSCSRKGLSPYLFPLLLLMVINVEDKRIEEIINQLMIAAVVQVFNEEPTEAEVIEEREYDAWRKKEILMRRLLG